MQGSEIVERKIVYSFAGQDSVMVLEREQENLVSISKTRKALKVTLPWHPKEKQTWFLHTGNKAIS